MKQLLFVSMLLLSICSVFTSCSKDEDSDTYCWKFTLKQVITASPSVSGYPQTTTTSTTQCGLTEAQADEAVSKLTTTTTTTTTSGSGYKVTVKTTATKQKVAEGSSDESGGGQRVPTGRP